MTARTVTRRPARGAFDEAFASDGSPRPGYGRLLEAVVGEPAAMAAAVSESLAERGVVFGPEGDRRTFPVDPLPRLIEAGEWTRIEAGLRQRVRALNLFLEDAYGDARIVAGGVVPSRVLDESTLFEPVMRESPSPVVAHVAGPDLVRDEDGRLRVLEDNLRTPSGLAYALAARAAVAGNPGLPDLPVRGLDQGPGLLAETIAAADPSGAPAALLSDGPRSFAWYEHRELARLLGIPLVTPPDLRVHDGRLVADREGSRLEIGVLYNRSSAESLRDRHGTLTPLGEILAGPLRTGELVCVNSFGSGVADDKAAYCYVDSMIRFYLDEHPLLPSVPSLDLGDPAAFSEAVERIGELVFKPRWEFGGRGIVFGPSASAAELGKLEDEIRRAPGDWVAQEPVSLSVHPTVSGDELEPRRIDLRPFVYTHGTEISVLPGGLTRFAGGPEQLVVNSTQGGGAKDTWVLR